ncbi:MAG: ArsR family transcriptional regulator [Methanomicrobiales archaeon]|nr:ArsR family transcriptional regulator [Methanomicrobiales archaeon]
MLDDGGNSRILDILGNKNRRRIIELLRQKPCFVTEISERLTISPKAVIEHLHLMEHENILRYNHDQRRRKYYYLAHDIDVIVRIEKNGNEMDLEILDQVASFYRSLAMLRRMIEARDHLITNLEHLEKDIETKAQEILSRGKEILQDDADLDIVFALGHYELTYDELREYTNLPELELRLHLEGLEKKGIINQTGVTYTLQELYAR